MATASVNRMMLWTDLEGRELTGEWRLVRLVRPEGRNAWFEATGPDGKPAMVSLTEALNDEDELLARLKAASTVRHRNVVAVREAQVLDLDETPVVMAAMEPTDENLADVLRERVLDAGEALPLMDALVQGLAAIHARRLVHGRMEPASVVAMGDTVKLRSDSLHLEGFAAGAGEDVRGLGRIVTQALTRRVPANENDPVLQLLPEPLGRAVRRALSGTATVEEIAGLVGTRIAPGLAAVRETRPEPAKSVAPGAAVAKPVEKPAEPEKPAMKSATTIVLDPARSTAKPSTEAATRAGQMDLPLRPRRTIVQDDEDEDAGRGRSWEKYRQKWMAAWDRLRAGKYHRVSAPWIVGAAVALVLTTVVVLHGLMHRASPANAGAATAQQRVVVERAPTRVEAAKPAAGRAAGAIRNWRVVVFTYRKRSEAEQKAAQLGKEHPDLQPSVLATRGGAYLVTVGGGMTRAEAFAERGRAVRAGLPRDSYAQNFRE